MAHHLHTGPGSGPSLAVRADAAQRAQRGWALRVAASWAQVAEAVGYTSATIACRAVRRYFGRLPQPSHDELRDLWRERQEFLGGQNAKAVREGAPGSVRAAVAIIRSTAQLDGLDAPARFQVETPDSERILAIVREIEEARRGVTAHEAEDIWDAEIEEPEGPTPSY
jgi:AraC-like DNA-binding protein